MQNIKDEYKEPDSYPCLNIPTFLFLIVVMIEYKYEYDAMYIYKENMRKTSWKDAEYKQNVHILTLNGIFVCDVKTMYYRLWMWPGWAVMGIIKTTRHYWYLKHLLLKWINSYKQRLSRPGDKWMVAQQVSVQSEQKMKDGWQYFGIWIMIQSLMLWDWVSS